MAAAADVHSVAKIPLFYNQKDKDSMPAREWLDRVQQAAIVQGWTDQQTVMAASNSLRGPAADWCFVEIKTHPNPTFTYFQERFMSLTNHDKAPYRGGLIWPQILNAHKADTVTNNYIQLAKHFILYNETLPAHVHHDSHWSAATLALPGVAALPAESRQAIAAESVQASRVQDMNRCAMCIFFCNLPVDAKNFLLARPEFSSLVEMKDAVEAFLKSHKSQNTSVNAVDDVDAIRRRQATSNARPDQPKRNLTCFYCNKKGHGQVECRKRARDGADLVKPPPRPPGQQQQQRGQPRNKVNETSETQQVHSAFQSHLNHLNS